MKKLKGTKIDYELYEFITLEKTNNEYWFAYCEKNDFTIKSRKKDDMIMKVWKGKKYKEV